MLSLPEIRNAEILEDRRLLHTSDGDVYGRPGDFAVSAPEGKEYPIGANIFYGAYEILGAVGKRLVARRLVHARIAWPVASATADFDYGPDRGTVTIDRGGWIYQSDDGDFGGVSVEAKHKRHVEVCAFGALGRRPWEVWFRRGAFTLAFLPTLLSFLALGAFAAATFGSADGIARSIIGVETAVLLGGVALAWWMRKDGWALKAAVNSGFSTAREFQPAVTLLGYEASHDFPGMALWRAAQAPATANVQSVITKPGIEADHRISALRSSLSHMRDALRHEEKQYHKAERIALRATLLALGVILCCNLYQIVKGHSPALEVLAIWLPSLIASIHAYNLRRQLGTRLSSTRNFSEQLKFVNDRLNAIVPHTSSAAGHSLEDFQASLRVLCKVVAQHAQTRIQLAVAEVPEVPV